MIKGMQIHIFELQNSITEYYEYCISKDAELFANLPVDVKPQVKATMEKLLKKKEKRAKKMQGTNSIWDGYYTTLQYLAG